MAVEYKYLPQFRKAADTPDGMTEIGVFCIHGNRDAGRDRSHNNAIGDGLMNGRFRAKYLWNHGGGMFDRGQAPPIATIKNIRELNRNELPDEVLAWAPDATGGVEVTRKYLKSELAAWVLEGIREEAINEMSYAYDVEEASFTEADGEITREIYKMSLYDISDVNWGMNPATLGSKSALMALPLEQHVTAVLTTADELIERMQEIKSLREDQGRNFNPLNMDRLKSLIDRLAPMQAAAQALLERPKPTDDKAAAAVLLEYQRTMARLNGVIIQ
jgi:hypothetical protein